MQAADVRPTERLITIGWWACLIACASALVWHFSMIELSILPQNAIAVHYRHQVNAYVHPLFVQNWNFFAPVPINDDISVIARVEQCNRPAHCGVSQWFAISDPLSASVRRNRLSSLGVVQIMLDNAANEYHNAIAGSADAYTTDGRHAKALRRVLPFRIDALAAEIMLRTSAAAIRARYPDRRIDRIQLGLYVYRYPRFSRRREPDRPERDGWIVPIEWKPSPKNIAPFVS